MSENKKKVILWGAAIAAIGILSLSLIFIVWGTGNKQSSTVVAAQAQTPVSLDISGISAVGITEDQEQEFKRALKTFLDESDIDDDYLIAMQAPGPENHFIISAPEHWIDVKVRPGAAVPFVFADLGPEKPSFEAEENTNQTTSQTEQQAQEDAAAAEAEKQAAEDAARIEAEKKAAEEAAAKAAQEKAEAEKKAAEEKKKQEEAKQKEAQAQPTTAKASDTAAIAKFLPKDEAKLLPDVISEYLASKGIQADGKEAVVDLNSVQRKGDNAATFTYSCAGVTVSVDYAEGMYGMAIIG